MASAEFQGQDGVGGDVRVSAADPDPLPLSGARDRKFELGSCLRIASEPELDLTAVRMHQRASGWRINDSSCVPAIADIAFSGNEAPAGEKTTPTGAVASSVYFPGTGALAARRATKASDSRIAAATPKYDATCRCLCYARSGVIRSP